MATDFDVIVVGAGMAGLCCAAEALRQGLRPVLVCETPEVGWALRSVQVGQSRGFVQHPMWQANLEGGSWYSAARFLNAPVKFHISPPLHLMNKDAGTTAELSFCTSPSAVVDIFSQLSPIPIDDLRPGMETILAAALSLSWTELADMREVPLRQWLNDFGADDFLAMAMYVLSANVTETTPDVAAEHLSFYGAMAMLRGLVCGEGPVTAPFPDPWEGLLVPLGRALEAKGCPVRRGAKVAHIKIDDGICTGVVLQNGDVITARATALAVGTPRVPKLVPDMPEEVRVPVEYAASLKGHDVCTFSLMDRDVCRLDNITMVADQTGSNLCYLFPMHSVAPGSTEPGKYLIAAQAQYTNEEFQDLGGYDGAVKQLIAVQEEVFPGFTDATIDRKDQTHAHHWLNPLTFGPKLPGRSSDLPGLYFAGDGSAPIIGIGVEGAGQAGVLRARTIAADLAT